MAYQLDWSCSWMQHGSIVLCAGSDLISGSDHLSTAVHPTGGKGRFQTLCDLTRTNTAVQVGA